MSKKVIAVFLTTFMLLSVFAGSAFAANRDLHNTATGDVLRYADFMEYDDEQLNALFDALEASGQDYLYEWEGKGYSYKDLLANVIAHDYDFEAGLEATTPVDLPAEGELTVVSVSAINLRELVVTFNKEVDEDSAETIGNYYVQLVDESTGAISTNSIPSKAGAETWTATLRDDNKSVLIKSTTGDVLNNPAGLDLKLNENYKIQVRNVKDADGNFTDVQEKGEVLKDTDRPTVELAETTVIDGNLVIEFNEPIKPGTANIYVDGNMVAAANITDVDNTTTVAAQKEITVDISSGGLDLANGAHTVSVVGAKDLNDNFITPNPSVNMDFTVASPEVETEKPEVDSITQIADNAFVIKFTTENVVAKSTSNVLTIKNGAYNTDATGGGAAGYVDIVLTDSDVVADPAGYPAIIPGTDADDDTTTWTVILDANDAGVDSATTDALAYMGANVISKDIVVENFINDNGNGIDGTDDAAGDKDDTTGEDFLMKKDVVAPTFVEIDSTGATLEIEFEDGPFAAPNGNVALGSGTDVLVKYVDDEGVTHAETVTVTGAELTANVLSVTLTNSDMLLDGELIPGATYSIELEDDVVASDEEDMDTTTPGDVELQEVDGSKSFVAPETPYTYTVPGQVDEVTGVPQTTKGLIISSEEAFYADANSSANYAKDVFDAIGTTLKDNQIIVQIDGDLDGQTAINKANYKLNDVALPSGATIELFTDSNIDGVAGDDQYVIITLPKEYTGSTGNYSFDVFNIANNDGDKMLPVSDSVVLTDSVAPEAQSVVTVTSNTIKVTFDENVANTGSVAQAAKNFKVLANGRTLSVTDLTISGKEVTLTLADNFDNAGDIDVPVTVEVKKDNNGQMFITDVVPAAYNYTANKAVEVTVSK